MSKLFYDHLVVLQEVEVVLSQADFSPAEKERVHHAIEETVHYRVLTLILDYLPTQHHAEFLDHFHRQPHNSSLMEFLKEKVGDIEELIAAEIKSLEVQLLQDIKSSFLSRDSSKEP